MDGAALSKAALLRSHLAVIKDDAKGLTPSACADVVSSLCSQSLLIESQLHGASAAARSQVAEATEQWYTALGKLISKTSLGPERCALVAPLLGATAAWCESTQLLLNYPVWGAHLVDALKRHRDTAVQQQQQGGGQAHLEAAAALCAAISKLFSRLQDFVDATGTGVRREGSALASRAAGIVLPLVSDTTSPSCQAAALQLLHVLLRALPTALRNHVPALEGALASTITSVRTPAAVKALAGQCLGGLAAAAGDAATYSTTFRRVLMSAHDVLDELFMGLEEAQPAPASYREGLMSGPAASAPAAAPASELGTQPAQPSQPSGILPPSSIPSVRGSPNSPGGAAAVRTLIEALGALIVAMEQMLVGAFPVAVPLPCAPLQRLVARIVRFSDASVLAAKRVPSSASGFAELQRCVPALHEAAWGLLTRVLRVAGASMAPHHSATARLLCEHLRRIWALGPGALGAMPPAVRTALFAATSAAVMAPVGGVGTAQAVSGDALGAACVELYGWMPGAVASGAAAGRAGQQPAAKKAKREAQESAAAAAEAAAAAAASAGPAGTVAVGSGALPAQLSALGLLEVLAKVAAPLMPPAQRAQLDSTAYHVASCAWAASQHAMQEPLAVTPSASAGLAALQAAAYKLLLASVLAPDSHRPPFLSQAVVLFSRGRGSASPHVAALCVSACSQMEGLLHPRSLPITSVLHAYPAHADLQPLPKPLMWSALDAARHGPAWAPAAMQAPPAAVAPSTQQPMAPAAAAASAAAAAALPKAVAEHPAPALAVPLFGAGRAFSEAPVQAQVAKKDAAPHAAASVPGTAAPPLFQAAALAPAPTVQPAPAAQQLKPAQSELPLAAAAAAAAPSAGPAAADPTPVPVPATHAPAVSKPSALLAGDESSDSEGSLPDLDSGSASSSDSDDNEGDS